MLKSKFNSLADWRKADLNAVAAAKKEGLLPEICKMFGWKTPKDRPVYFDDNLTKIECLNDALKFSCKGMWRLKSPVYYNTSKRKFWFDECTSHMYHETWDFDSCLSEAKLFENNWSSKSPNSYSWALKNNYIDKINLLVNKKSNIKTIIKQKIDSLTKEECISYALNYKFKNHWCKGHQLSYAIAKKNGWLEECTAHMPLLKIKKAKYKYWTKEKCLEIALTCENRTEFGEKYQGAYLASKKNGWYEECIAHMVDKIKTIWTKEKCLEVALTCENRTEFQIKYAGAYNASKKNGWFEECTAHFNVLKTFWTKEKCLEVALTCENRTEFRIKYAGAYNASKKNGWFEECTAHFNVLKTFWTKEKCLEVALTCKFKYEWEKKCGKTYYASKKNGWFEECTAHMVNKNITKECCISSALKFNHRWPWEKNNRVIVTVAKNNGWYEECITHMEKYNAKPANFWDLDAVIESTKGYDSFSKWLKANRGAYNTSRRNGWVDKVKSCFENVKTFTIVKYDKITCIKKAREYTNYLKFTRTLTGIYLAAKENGWLDECCQHMENYKNKVV